MGIDKKRVTLRLLFLTVLWELAPVACYRGRSSGSQNSSPLACSHPAHCGSGQRSLRRRRQDVGHFRRALRTPVRIGGDQREWRAGVCPGDRLCKQPHRTAAKLIEGGMSQRQAAKALGVGKGTIQRDVDRSGPRGGPKRATKAERRGRAGAGPALGLPSRPGEFHPEPLTEPDVSLSTYPARATARRLPPSIGHRVPPVAG